MVRGKGTDAEPQFWAAARFPEVMGLYNEAFLKTTTSGSWSCERLQTLQSGTKQAISRKPDEANEEKIKSSSALHAK